MKKLLCLFSAGLLGVSFLLTTPVQAKIYDFEIDSFHSDLTVNEDGTLRVVETIDTNFLESKRGIIRDLPRTYEVNKDLDIRTAITVNGVTDQYGQEYPIYIKELYDRVSIRIGDAEVYHTGKMLYVIDYTVEAPYLYFEDHDEIYWNITGTDWTAPISQSSATIHLPSKATMTEASCYTGLAGSIKQNCTINDLGNTVNVTGTGFLTVAVGFTPDIIAEVSPELIDYAAIRAAGEVAHQAELERRAKKKRMANWFVGLPFVMAVFAFFFAGLIGSDEKKYKGAIIAQFDPPHGLRPTEAAVLYDGILNKRDFSAAIVDLAVRGHLKIVEMEKGYTLLNTKGAGPKLRKWEKLLLKTIFAGKASASQNSISYRVGWQIARIKDLIYMQLKADGFFRKNPEKVRRTYSKLVIVLGVIIVIASLFVAVELNNPIPFIGALLSPFFMFPFKRRIKLRTAKGVEAVAYIEGLKLFIKTAERYRVKWQEDEGLFEKYLPYAMVFKLVKKWSKAFEDMQVELHQNVTVPTWYKSTNSIKFAPVAFSTSVATFGKIMSSSFKSHSMSSGSSSYRAPRFSGISRSSGSRSSSSSRSSGGGRSGGGFGGGGGSSW